MATSSVPGSGILQVVSTGGTLLNPTTTSSTNAAPLTPEAVAGGEGGIGLNITTGWYVFFGLGAGILLSGTEIAPIALGILTVALLYQITQLIEGK